MKLDFDYFLFNDDFECLLQWWSKETNNNFLKEESEDSDDIEYIYDSKSFRQWYHNNKIKIERELQLNSILK